MDLSKYSLEELISKLGFHFTSQDNEESIKETGIEARIGNNSSGDLGKEAIKKAFISTGIEGCMRTFNRTINAAIREVNLKGLRTDTHSRFIPESAADRPEDQMLTFEEALEFVKRYMETNEYFVFDAPAAQYEGEATEEDIQRANDKIQRVVDEMGISRSEIPNYSIELREKTIGIIDNARGALISDGVYDVVDFNEERAEWLVQPCNNVHTRIVRNEKGQLEGRGIPTDEISVATIDGKKDAISIMEYFMKYVDKINNYSRKRDVPMIEAFLKYARLPEDISLEERAAVLSEIRRYYDEKVEEIRIKVAAEKASKKEVSISSMAKDAIRDLRDKGITQDIIALVEQEESKIREGETQINSQETQK